MWKVESRIFSAGGEWKNQEKKGERSLVAPGLHVPTIANERCKIVPKDFVRVNLAVWKMVQ